MSKSYKCESRERRERRERSERRERRERHEYICRNLDKFLLGNKNFI